jgi:hypothetical protein
VRRAVGVLLEGVLLEGVLLEGGALTARVPQARRSTTSWLDPTRAAS